MNYAVNHLRTEMHTEKTDHEDTEAIAQDGEWNDERDKGKPSPPTSQEQIGSQDAGYKNASSIEYRCISRNLVVMFGTNKALRKRACR
jgi:hypothetical protein